MQIDQETFNATKALSEIQVALSAARAELKSLQETTEDYLKFREDEVNKRIAKVLRESREALDNISKNHEELVLFRDELTAFAASLKNSSSTIVALFENFRKAMDEADLDMQEHYASVNNVLKDIKIERSKVESDRMVLKGEMKKLEDETRLVIDRRQTLERGFKELKKLKAKKHE